MAISSQKVQNESICGGSHFSNYLCSHRSVLPLFNKIKFAFKRSGVKRSGLTSLEKRLEIHKIFTSYQCDTAEYV